MPSWGTVEPSCRLPHPQTGRKPQRGCQTQYPARSQPPWCTGREVEDNTREYHGQLLLFVITYHELHGSAGLADGLSIGLQDSSEGGLVDGIPSYSNCIHAHVTHLTLNCRLCRRGSVIRSPRTTVYDISDHHSSHPKPHFSDSVIRSPSQYTNTS